MNNYQALEVLISSANKMYSEKEQYVLYYRDYKMYGVWKGNLEVRQKTEDSPEFGIMRLRVTKELPANWAEVGNEQTKNDLAEGMMCMLFSSGIDRAIVNTEHQKLN